MPTDPDTLLAVTADIVAAHLSNIEVVATDLSELIGSTHAALAGLGAPPAVEAEPEHTPAVTARKSLADSNRISSMIDGKPYTSLKRHLQKHRLAPAEYRARYKLASDYPTTAPGYSEKRRVLAKQLGLGRKRADDVEQAAPSRKAAGPKRAAAANRILVM